VFAAWVANKPLSEAFIQQFKQANDYGLQHLDKVIAENPYSEYDLKKYYMQNISFTLTAEKRKGMELFLKYLDTL
jgi:chorismate dehydratase